MLKLPPSVNSSSCWANPASSVLPGAFQILPCLMLKVSNNPPMRCWPTIPDRCFNTAPPKANKGAVVTPEGLIVTTGSQQALDLIGKTMISPGDKVIVEAPTFLATIQCFRLYGANIVGAPIDADGVDVDRLEKLIEEHKPKLVYLIPTFGNPSGATLSLARRKRVLEIAARTKTLVVEDDPYGELYFDQPPPPLSLI